MKDKHTQQLTQKKNQTSSHKRKESNQRHTRFQIFVGGCHPDMKESDLINYFNQFGVVKEVRMMIDKVTGKFRGFSFIGFSTKEGQSKATKDKIHVIRGKESQVKLALSKEETRQKLIEEKERKLFLINLEESISKDIIINYFIRFGEIEETRIIEDRRKKKPKKYGFVLFKHKSGLKEAVKIGDSHDLGGGFFAECKPTLLREELKEIQKKGPDCLSEVEGNTEAKKNRKKLKKRLRRLKRKYEKLKESGKNCEEIYGVIIQEEIMLGRRDNNGELNENYKIQRDLTGGGPYQEFEEFGKIIGKVGNNHSSDEENDDYHEKEDTVSQIKEQPLVKKITEKEMKVDIKQEGKDEVKKVAPKRGYRLIPHKNKTSTGKNS